MTKRLLAIILSFCFLTFSMEGEDLGTKIKGKQKELREIEKQLKESEKKYEYFGNQEGSLLKGLSDIRDRTTRVTRDKEKAVRNMKKLEREVSLLTGDIEKLEEKQSRIKKVLGAVVLSSFLNSRRSSSGPSLSAGIYAGRNEALLTQIGNFNYYLLRDTATTIELTAGKVDKKNRTFERYRLNYLDRKIAEKKLTALERDKNNALKSIRSKKEYYDRLITELTARKKQLTGLIRELEKSGSKYSSGVNFADLKGALIWPAAGTVYSGFGKNVDKTYKTVTSNDGIDIKTSPGGAVKSVAGGRVVFAEEYKSMGIMVVIDHGGSYYTVYLNLAAVSVKNGQVVTAGQNIGSTARDAITGIPTLHFEIRRGAKAVSPLSWLTSP